MAITEEQVFSAAEEIRDSGRFPSAISIREITKSGSLGTIQKHLRKWRHRETVSASNHNPPPDEVLEALRSFGENFWRLALQHSDRAALQKVRLARDEQEEAHRDMEEALENLEVQRLETESLAQQLEDVRKNEKNLIGELELQKGMVQKASLQCHKLEESLKSLDERFRDIQVREQDHLEELKHLREELKGQQALLENSHFKRKELEVELDRVRHDLIEYRELSDALTGQTEEGRQRLKEAKAQIGQLQEEREAQARELEQERNRFQDLQQAFQETRIQLESTQLVNQKLDSLLNQLKPQQHHEGRQDQPPHT